MSAGHQTGAELIGKQTNGAALKKESLNKKLINLQPELKKSIIVLADNHVNDPLDNDILVKVQKSIRKILF